MSSFISFYSIQGQQWLCRCYDLYSFDKELRTLLFVTIQMLKVSIRTRIIKHFALEFGAFGLMDENYATNEPRFTVNLAVIRKEVSPQV